MRASVPPDLGAYGEVAVRQSFQLSTRLGTAYLVSVIKYHEECIRILGQGEQLLLTVYSDRESFLNIALLRDEITTTQASDRMSDPILTPREKEPVAILAIDDLHARFLGQ